MSSKRIYLLLILGAVVGVGVAIFETVTQVSIAELSGHAATVNGRPILKEDYQRALNAVANDGKNSQLSADDKQRILGKLIDEELLMQQAESLELQRQDPQVRGILVRAVIDSLVEESALGGAPDEKSLRAYYEREANRYRSPLRVRLEHTYLKGKSAESLSAAKQIAQGKGREAGDEFGMPIGNGWVPLSMVSQRLGSNAARAVGQLSVGQSSAPIESTSGYHVVRLLETRGGEILPFERARENVRADYERDRGDEALRSFLVRQRKRADIELGEP